MAGCRVAWIDINNLAAKVPQINGAVYVKILKLKESAHNKLFHIDKLRKADLVKQGVSSTHAPVSAPKSAQNNPSPQPRVPTNIANTPSTAPKPNNAPLPPQNVPQQQRNPTNTPPPSQIPPK